MRISKTEKGFTLLELLIVVVILGILATVVALKASGFLGAGTEEMARTQLSTLQTAILAGMANASVGTISPGTVLAGQTTNVTVSYTGGSFNLETYLNLPTHGTWNWGTSGMVSSGNFSGGGKTCSYDSSKPATEQWNCTAA